MWILVLMVKVETRIPTEKPMKIKLGVDYFSLSLLNKNLVIRAALGSTRQYWAVLASTELYWAALCTTW